MIDKQVIVMRSDLKNYDGLKIRKLFFHTNKGEITHLFFCRFIFFSYICDK